jgi:hypothetical protein
MDMWTEEAKFMRKGSIDTATICENNTFEDV